ncbi:MAG TPA: hypothetical protein VLW52_04670 [Opitutaceae bacterium]|nr:hypothetical protein [Opitutaceae bacterium]
MKPALLFVPGDVGRLVPITLSQLVGLACGIAGVKLVTRLVPPGDYGAYGVFLTFAPLGMWVVHAGLIKFVGRHWAAARDRRALLGEVARAALRKMPWLVLAAAGAAGLMSARAWLEVFPAVFLAAALLSCGALAQAALQAARENWRDLAVSSAGSATRSFVPPLLYLVAGGSVLALYGGYCLHALTLACAGAWALRRYWRAAAPARREITPVYEGPLFVGLALTGWTLAGFSRWVMALWFGPAETGFFVLAGNLATLVPSMLGTISLQYFQPGFFAAATEAVEPRRALARHVDVVALGHAAVALAGLAALRLVAPLFVGPIIDEHYRPALGLLMASGCAALAVTTGLFYHSLLLAGKRERACGPVELTAAVVLIGGGLATAACGEAWFLRWLLVSPVVPWLVNRPLARRHYFRPA